jgi:formamidopyrimidine-DNA glycosylase
MPPGVMHYAKLRAGWGYNRVEMPELPEVETTRRDLEREVAGHRIAGASVWQTRMLGGQAPDTISARLAGRIVRNVERRGKFLFLCLDSDDALMIHRGMTGNLLLAAPREPALPHLHLTLELDDGRELRLHDPRGFGEIRMLSATEVADRWSRLGPEPLGPDFTVEYLAGQFGRRTALVKALLLNQAIVAGLGNIYVDEALWAARLHPTRRANTLVPAEVVNLHNAIVRLLTAAIELRGVTFNDHRDLYGEPGSYAPHLQVFHRAHELCPRTGCGEAIRLIRAAGRGSSICPACQPAPAGVETECQIG